MYFKVVETFDYKEDKYTYTIYRESYPLRVGLDKAGIEKFVLDRACLYDSDLIEYGWGCLGIISGKDAREILSKKDVVPMLITEAWGGYVGKLAPYNNISNAIFKAKP